MSQSTPKLAVTVPEAAQATGFSENYLRLLISKRLLQHVRVGRAVRVMAADLETFLQEGNHRGMPVTGPLVGRPAHGTVFRDSRENQPPAFDGGRLVRLVGEDDALIDVCTPDRLGRYLDAPNAELQRRADGSIRLFRLRSVGDDRGHLGDGRGRSTVATERVRNDWGALAGSELNIKHKKARDTWGHRA